MPARQHADKQAWLYGVVYAVSFLFSGKAVDELLGDLRFQAVQLRDSIVAAIITIRCRFYGRNQTFMPVFVGFPQWVMALKTPS